MYLNSAKSLRNIKYIVKLKMKEKTVRNGNTII